MNENEARERCEMLLKAYYDASRLYMFSEGDDDIKERHHKHATSFLKEYVKICKEFGWNTNLYHARAKEGK